MNGSKKISERQKAILDFIKNEIRHNGIPPSIREICKHAGFKSTSVAHYHLNTLEQKGYLQRGIGKNRSIKILDNDFYNSSIDTVDVPVLGRVAAGEPILSVENIEDTYPLPKQFVKGNDIFMLRIFGDSMIDAGILDKDLVIVRQQSYAYNNDIVIAMLDDAVTCKRFFKEKKHFRLQPENDAYEPIITNEVAVIGKVIGLFRSM